jgi:hypothetical protein
LSERSGKASRTAPNDSALKILYENKTREETSQAFIDAGLSGKWGTIKTYAHSRGWKRSPETSNRFKPEEDALIKEYGAKTSDIELVLLLEEKFKTKRTVASVKGRRLVLGVKRSICFPVAPIFGTPIKRDRDALIIGCLHAPGHDAAFVNKVCDLADAWHIGLLVLAGDFVSLDMFSKWLHFHELTPEKEKENAQNVLRDLSERFEEIVYIIGNHEERVSRETGGNITPHEYVQAHLVDAMKLTNVTVSPFRWCRILGWHIEHTKRSGGGNPGLVPSNIATQYEMPVAVAHSHRWGLVQDRTGKRLVAEIGHASDVRRLGYGYRVTFSAAQSTQGALILKKVGDQVYPYLLHPTRTDFEGLKKVYA